ncbi:MAG TPA: hypothetical protein VGK89_02690 [Candidatus Eisenbacteria bacterium]|jgi:hypothetical protein
MNPDRRMIVAQWTGWALAAAALVALGALWAWDRGRVWESPRWDDARLSRLAGGGGGAVGSAARDGGAVETWVVAVNPDCPHCRASLARALEIRLLARAPIRIAALIVDAGHRPSPAVLAALAADEVRWDSTFAWRRRWGHRIYGELLCFDRSGTLVRTLAPLGDSIDDRRASSLGESLRREGGS